MFSLFLGSSYEHPCTAVLAGSGGGKSSASGGGVLYVSVEKLLELDGWIKADGVQGDGGGGGASGGSIWVAGRHFEGDTNEQLYLRNFIVEQYLAKHTFHFKSKNDKIKS